jgi:hypothetical protein
VDVVKASGETFRSPHVVNQPYGMKIGAARREEVM